jgi:hypothetical protein
MSNWLINNPSVPFIASAALLALYWQDDGSII